MNDKDLHRLIGPDKWKLWLFGAMLSVAGFGIFLPERIGRTLGVDGILVQGSALVLIFSALVWTFFSIRCRHCGLRLVMYAMSRKGVGEWLQWLLMVKQCPQCGWNNNSIRGADDQEHIFLNANSLSIEQARIMVDQLVINRDKLFVDRGCANSVFHEQLGPITKEFFSKYRILHTQSGGFRLAAGEIGPSEYMKGYLSVGHSEDWDVIQYPGDDTIFVVEGSEHSRDEIDVRFRSIYHLVLDEAQKA